MTKRKVKRKTVMKATVKVVIYGVTATAVDQLGIYEISASGSKKRHAVLVTVLMRYYR